jgi:hypothetical protein
MAQEILNVLFALAAWVAILEYFGFKPKQRSGGGKMSLSRKWKLVLMLSLVGASLALSGYGFYRSFHPRIIEKTVEKPVDRVVEKVVQAQCPKTDSNVTANSGRKKAKKDPTAPVAQPQQPSMAQDGNCAQSSGQTGGITAGAIVVDTPPLKITWTAEDAASDKPVEFPYAPHVIVNVNTLYAPVSLAITCDSEIARSCPMELLQI